MPPPGGSGGAEVSNWLDEPLTEFEVRKNVQLKRTTGLYLKK